MISNYIFYLYTVSNGEKFVELFILFILFIILFVICMILNCFKSETNKNEKTH